MADGVGDSVLLYELVDAVLDFHDEAFEFAWYVSKERLRRPGDQLAEGHVAPWLVGEEPFPLGTMFQVIQGFGDRRGLNLARLFDEDVFCSRRCPTRAGPAKE